MDDPWGDDDDDILAQAVDHAEEVFFAEDDEDDWLLSQSLADVEEQLELNTSHLHSSQTDHQRNNKVPQTNSTSSAWPEGHFSKDSFHLKPENQKRSMGVMHGQQGSSHPQTNTVTKQFSSSSTITSLSETPNSKQPSSPSTSRMKTNASSPKDLQCKQSSSHSNASSSMGKQQKKTHQTEKTSTSETYTKGQQNSEEDICDKNCDIQCVDTGISKETDAFSQSGVGTETSVAVAGGSGVMSGTSGNRNSDKDMEEELQKQKQSLERVKNTLDSELQCSICNELFVQATSLNCAHAFCALCISQWMKTSTNCPMCRTKIISKNRSLVLDSFIDKMCEQLGEEMREDRKALLEERRNEQAKFDEANPQHSRASQGQTRTASPTRSQYDDISPTWQHSDETSSSTSLTDSDYSDEYRTSNRNLERRGRDSDSLYSTDSSATDFSDHSPRSRQRRRDRRHRERRRRRQHRRGRHTDSDSSMSAERREDWRRRRRSEGMRMRRRMRMREQERREQRDEHSDEDSRDSHDEESSHGRDRRHRGRRRAIIESSSEATDWEDARHVTERRTRRNSQSRDRDRSRSRERSNNRRQGSDRRSNVRSDDDVVSRGRGTSQHTGHDSSYQSTSTASSQGSTSSSASIPATSRARPTRSTTSYGVARLPRRTQLINIRPETRRSFYGGYGNCYKCGRSGHWANGCIYR